MTLPRLVSLPDDAKPHRKRYERFLLVGRPIALPHQTKRYYGPLRRLWSGPEPWLAEQRDLPAQLALQACVSASAASRYR